MSNDPDLKAHGYRIDPAAGGLDTVWVNPSRLLDRSEGGWRAAAELFSAMEPGFLEAGQSSVVFIDAGFYDRVFVGLGYSSAERFAEQFARRLHELLSCQAILTRVHTDLFAVILVTENLEKLLSLIKELIAKMSAPFRIEDLLILPDVCLGLEVLNHPATSDIDTAIRKAAVAAGFARQRRRSWAFYEAEQDTVIQTQMGLTADLWEGMRQGEIELHYQPKVSLKTNQIIGVEALARWRHRTRGLVSPGEWISVMETTPLIGPFTDFVARVALSQIGQWSRSGFHVPIAINISAYNLTEGPGMVELINIVKGMGTCDLFEIELTETALITNYSVVMRTLHWLRDQGIRIYVDDFGTGYSSLKYLQLLPVNGIKLDQSFISNLLVSPKSENIVASSIALAHDFDMTVVAEGVEDQATLDYLRAMGCDEIQGFHAYRPMPAKDLTSIFSRELC